MTEKVTVTQAVAQTQGVKHSLPEPIKGRIVEFNAGDIGGPLPAMIAFVWPEERGLVNLSVLGHDGTWVGEQRVVYDAMGETQRSWRWPAHIRQTVE